MSEARGGGQWRVRLAWRRLRRNPAAVGSALVLLLILFVCFPGAPLWVHYVCHHGPNDQNIQGYVHEGGHKVPVVADDGTPIGPGLRACYLLGADPNGRDLFVRLLYGGRISLIVGVALGASSASRIALVLGVARRLRRRARPTRLISRALDLIWSFPVYLLAVALATTFAVGGTRRRAAPRLVDARSGDPDRGDRHRLRALRGPADPRPGAVAAADGVRRGGGRHGAGPLRVMARELLPNIVLDALVFLTLIVANNILTEAALSFLGVGVPMLTPELGQHHRAGLRSRS